MLENLWVYIEAEAGSYKKRKINESTLEPCGFRMTRRRYPYPYGFIMNTRTDDGEAIDCYIITKKALKGGTSVECVPMGLLEMFENGETDHKVLAGLPGETPRIDENLRNELEEFILEIFKRFPDMDIQVGRLLSKETAEKHIAANPVE